MKVQFAIDDVFDDFVQVGMHAILLTILQKIDLLKQFQVRVALGVQDLVKVSQFGVIVHHHTLAPRPLDLP